MTENEALEYIKNMAFMCGEYEKCQYGHQCTTKCLKATEIAIKALSEIQQYRAIGTVEELKSMKENGAFTGVELAQLATMQMRLKEYSAIGTVEEFKALKEKNNEHYSDTDELDGYGYTCTNKTCVERIRNKAIDDFVEKSIKIVYEANNRDRNPQPRDMVADIHYKFIELAEQLKAGGENDNLRR